MEKIEEESPSSLVKAAKQFFSGTMLSRITGMVRDVSMASFFGTDPSVAALMMAFRLSNLLRRLLGEGAMNSVFIPHFEEARKESPQKASEFFRDLSFSLSLFLLLLVLFVEGGITASLFTIELSADNREWITLTALMFPAIIFISLSGVNTALLQCERKHFIAAAAPILFNLTWIIAVWSMRSLEVSEAMKILASVIVLAYLLQWLATLIGLSSFLKESGSLSHFWAKGKLFSQRVRRMGKPLFLAILGVGAIQINAACDSFFARYADLEGPAYLWYAIRLQQLPLALFGIAISGAFLPTISRVIKQGKDEKARELLIFALNKSSQMMIASSFAIFTLAFPTVVIIYGRGDFSAEAVQQTALALSAYGIGLLPTTSVILLAAVHYAKGDFRFPATISFLSLLVNLLLNSIFIFLMKWGVLSVALATSLSAWGNLWLIGRKGILQTAEKRAMKKIVAITSFCCALASFLALLIGYQFLADRSSLFYLGVELFEYKGGWWSYSKLFLQVGFIYLSTILILNYGIKKQDAFRK